MLTLIAIALACPVALASPIRAVENERGTASPQWVVGTSAIRKHASPRTVFSLVTIFNSLAAYNAGMWSNRASGGGDVEKFTFLTTGDPLVPTVVLKWLAALSAGRGVRIGGLGSAPAGAATKADVAFASCRIGPAALLADAFLVYADGVRRTLVAAVFALAALGCERLAAMKAYMISHNKKPPVSDGRHLSKAHGCQQEAMQTISGYVLPVKPSAFDISIVAQAG